MGHGQRTLEERLFSAAVLLRTFELSGSSGEEGFRFVYGGVLGDLGLEEPAVAAFLEAHRREVDAAIAGGGRR